MKLFKKFIGAALACAAVLVLLTACGSTGSSTPEAQDMASAVNTALKSSGSKVVLTTDDELTKDAKALAEAIIKDAGTSYTNTNAAAAKIKGDNSGKEIIVVAYDESGEAIADAITQQNISATKIGCVTFTWSYGTKFYDSSETSGTSYICATRGTVVVLK